MNKTIDMKLLSLLEHFHFLKVFTIHGVDVSSLLESISMTNVHYVHNSIV
jgi:hypothetical protein